MNHITLEQVERLREKANVSFEEAKAALEATDGNLLNALISLERQGKVAAPSGNGYYSSQGQSQTEEEAPPRQQARQSQPRGESFGAMLRRFGRFCLRVLEKGNHNYLEAERNGNQFFSMPVTVVVLLLLCFFWVTIPLFIISLFVGCRYRFRGEDLGRDAVNRVMDKTADTVDDIKKTFNETK